MPALENTAKKSKKIPKKLKKGLDNCERKWYNKRVAAKVAAVILEN